MDRSEGVPGVLRGKRLLFIAALAGAALGFAGAYADFRSYTGALGAVGAIVGNTAAGWLLVAAVIGALSSRPVEGMRAGAISLLSADVMYYGSTLAFGQRGVGAQVLGSAALGWGVAGIVAGSLAGGAGVVVRDRERWTTVFLCAAVGGAVLSLPMYHLMLTFIAGPPFGFHTGSSGQIAINAFLAVLGLALPLAWPRGARKMLAAVSLALVAGLALGGAQYVRWSAASLAGHMSGTAVVVQAAVTRSA